MPLVREYERMRRREYPRVPRRELDGTNFARLFVDPGMYSSSVSEDDFDFTQSESDSSPLFSTLSRD